MFRIPTSAARPFIRAGATALPIEAGAFVAAQPMPFFISKIQPYNVSTSAQSSFLSPTRVSLSIFSSAKSAWKNYLFETELAKREQAAKTLLDRTELSIALSEIVALCLENRCCLKASVVAKTIPDEALRSVAMVNVIESDMKRGDLYLAKLFADSIPIDSVRFDVFHKIVQFYEIHRDDRGSEMWDHVIHNIVQEWIRNGNLSEAERVANTISVLSKISTSARWDIFNCWISKGDPSAAERVAKTIPNRTYRDSALGRVVELWIKEKNLQAAKLTADAIRNDTVQKLEAFHTIVQFYVKQRNYGNGEEIWDSIINEIVFDYIVIGNLSEAERVAKTIPDEKLKKRTMDYIQSKRVKTSRDFGSKKNENKKSSSNPLAQKLLNLFYDRAATEGERKSARERLKEFGIEV